ncbi:phosphatidylserine lipase ABHD16A-like [Paramacrobiotus metropolitanus]|uniref:phosphatidylserine lipase ABHD16A-like n=1 Tax=Paramacrobiotus metropolitanus TaxID=2943436 RepID=UPI0024460DE6|nr:phosphatidylserine lipase ABHD16A-like [Paramacrobiotus metropolitanus]XP_055335174.1 phosphatidylserine lipase ABHD16A-like [Paramacrobiotus metropolitanus]
MSYSKLPNNLTWNMSPARSFFSPDLYRVYRPGFQGENYAPNRLERCSTYMLYAVKCFWFAVKLCSPLWIFAIYRRGASAERNDDAEHPDGALGKFLLPVLRPFMFVMSVAGLAYAFRWTGRRFNHTYRQFMTDFDAFHKRRTPENYENLMKKYDFDCASQYHIPCVYSTKAALRRPIVADALIGKDMNVLVRSVYKVLALLLLKTIGRRLLYPGSLKLFNLAIKQALTDGRAKIMENAHIRARHATIGTSDGNTIDTMFVDNRSASASLGNTLVICCEGNAGYYELGIMNTPMHRGYSVLGWNHPGFGYSTGEPLPSQELHAADAVMRYAKEHLGFDEANILLFAWSIGGFPASYLAASYPNVQGVILDATFDDLLPLAHARMPRSLSHIVTFVVRHYLNLNVGDWLCQYDGPVLLIRRTLDEILAIHDTTRDFMVNRADFLLTKILSHRYPHIVNSGTKDLLDQWLMSDAKERETMYIEYLRGVSDDDLSTLVENYLAECAITEPSGIRFPLDIGKNLDASIRQHLTLYLAKLHMKDLEETHCTPLPPNLFTDPWHPFQKIV